jgi:deazaflavin-dependent oxidoreductase (nitroreductase family)
MATNTESDTERGFDGEYVPSPLERIRKQVADYEASGGTRGGTVEGAPVVIVTSVGAKSGKVRKKPVVRFVDGDRYVAVASHRGALTNPSWYANLVAHPRVRLQDGATVSEFQAREVSGDEKQYYWTVAERFWPPFPEYRRLAGGRDIPLEAFDTLANRRDFVAAQRFWPPDYIQHSAHIPPGRDGLFKLVKASPPDRRYENALAIANGDYVVLHGRLSSSGLQTNRITVDIVRLEGGLIAEHWDVVQDEATAEQSKSGLPMFGDAFGTPT